MSILRGLSYEDYEALPGLRKSALWTLLSRSPGHYKYEIEHPREDTPELAFGRAFHAWLLEREFWDSRYLIGQKFDRRTKEGKAAALAFEAQAAGLEIIAWEDHARIRVMAEKVFYHEEAHALLEEGEAEVSLLWEMEGLACKGRLDWWVEEAGIFLDIKTTRDASPAAFTRDAARYGYFMQAAFYAQGLHLLTGGLTIPYFIAIEKALPHEVAVYEITPEALAFGGEQAKEALRILADCERTGNWRAWSGVQKLAPPRWAAPYQIYD